jgi:hypothetical protein
LEHGIRAALLQKIFGERDVRAEAFQLRRSLGPPGDRLADMESAAAGKTAVAFEAGNLERLRRTLL